MQARRAGRVETNVHEPWRGRLRRHVVVAVDELTGTAGKGRIRPRPDELQADADVLRRGREGHRDRVQRLPKLCTPARRAVAALRTGLAELDPVRRDRRVAVVL